MRTMIKFPLLIGLMGIMGFLATSFALAYEEGGAGEAIVEGKITFKGEPPTPRQLPFFNSLGGEFFENAKYCSQFDNDGKGNRVRKLVNIKNDRLADVVVYIQNISKGKTFNFGGTFVKINGCRYLVQGGPSTWVGVVVNNSEIRILNEDANPDNPRSIDGVLHNPHGHTIKGVHAYTMFSLAIPNKKDVLKEKVNLKYPDGVMHLGCDQHDGMEEAWFYPIENPYYAIVGAEGTYLIDQVPPGKYTLLPGIRFLEPKKRKLMLVLPVR